MVTNQGLFERARRVIPGGVNSAGALVPVGGGAPRTLWPGPRGPMCGTWRGNRYIDYVQSYGPGILGHAHPAVTDAVAKAAADGTSYGAPTEREVLLAEPVVRPGTGNGLDPAHLQRH